MTKESKIREMVAAYALKSSYGTEPYFEEIRELGADVIPYFLEAYPDAKYWQQRASYLYRSLRHAKTSEAALALAIMALEDRSREVRYRACMLLACSQNANALPGLKKRQSTKIPIPGPTRRQLLTLSSKEITTILLIANIRAKSLLNLGKMPKL